MFLRKKQEKRKNSFQMYYQEEGNQASKVTIYA
jgi:hypothetical protein